MNAQEIIDLYLRNKAFYRNGGITVTGGEPLLQVDFLHELFTMAKKQGIHTCVDTSGIVFNRLESAKLEELMKVTDLVLLDEYPHYFSMVPVAIFKNNEEETGDFENVISLIDAYDKMESDSLNDFEYFVDAYLALYGLTAEEEDVARMKENRVLLMDEGTKAEWLIK